MFILKTNKIVRFFYNVSIQSWYSRFDSMSLLIKLFIRYRVRMYEYLILKLMVFFVNQRIFRIVLVLFSCWKILPCIIWSDFLWSIQKKLKSFISDKAPTTNSDHEYFKFVCAWSSPLGDKDLVGFFLLPSECSDIIMRHQTD